jgi:RNA polymerase sigma-70 factor, ECF subfamily
MAHDALSQSVPDEAQLIERARQNDYTAIRLIIKQQNRRLYRIARSIVRDDSEAEDALQEAYVRAFSNLDSFRGEARFGTWLARIVINEALTAAPQADRRCRSSCRKSRSERSDYFLSLCQSRTRS